MGPVALLTVKGRKTGKNRRNPVGLFDYKGHRYISSTFSQVNWVQNVRVVSLKIPTGQKTSLGKGGTCEQLSRHERPLSVSLVIPASKGKARQMRLSGFKVNTQVHPELILDAFRSLNTLF